MSNKESKKAMYFSAMGYLSQAGFYCFALLFFAVMLTIAITRDLAPAKMFCIVLLFVAGIPFINMIYNAVVYSKNAKELPKFTGKISNWKKLGYYSWRLMLYHDGQEYDSGPFFISKAPEKFVGKTVEYCIIENKVFILRIVEVEDKAV